MEPEKKSHGALIGSIIVIVILIIGGIYVWQSKVKQMKLEQKRIEMQIEASNAANLNEVNTLEQELDTTDLELNLDLEELN